jgi:hypothetical protein
VKGGAILIEEHFGCAMSEWSLNDSGAATMMERQENVQKGSHS